MIELVLAAVIIPLVLVACFAIADAMAERRAQEHMSRPQLPSYVRKIPRTRLYDQDRDR